MSYTRNYSLILLVGLTELKAQVCWNDSVTVSTQGVTSLTSLSDFRDLWDLGGGEKVRTTVTY